MISVPRLTMTTPSTAATSDCARNVHCDPNTLTIILPALTALPTTHCTLLAYNGQYTKGTWCSELPSTRTMPIADDKY